MTSPGKARRGARACYRAGVALLFFTVVALSVQAKDSRYLAPSNPARHVSKISRMEETSTQGEGMRAAFVRCGQITPRTRPRLAEKPALPLVGVEVPRLKLPATFDPAQLRSPPSVLV